MTALVAEAKSIVWNSLDGGQCDPDILVIAIALLSQEVAPKLLDPCENGREFLTSLLQAVAPPKLSYWQLVPTWFLTADRRSDLLKTAEAKANFESAVPKVKTLVTPYLPGDEPLTPDELFDNHSRDLLIYGLVKNSDLDENFKTIQNDPSLLAEAAREVNERHFMEPYWELLPSEASFYMGNFGEQNSQALLVGSVEPRLKDTLKNFLLERKDISAVNEVSIAEIRRLVG